MRKWLQEEHECKKGGPIDLSDWEDYWDDVSFSTFRHTHSLSFSPRLLTSSLGLDYFFLRTFLNKTIRTIVEYSP